MDDHQNKDLPGQMILKDLSLSHLFSGKHRRILSFIGCFAAGVFLGACIMHMVADALGDIETEIRKRQHMVSAVMRALISILAILEQDCAFKCQSSMIHHFLLEKK